jgi:hypothetical protein
VLVFNPPLNLDPADKKHREELHEANRLELNTITSFRWAKPPNRRSPNQRSAHLIIFFADPDSANRAISNGITICNKRCHAERVKREPIRCLVNCTGNPRVFCSYPYPYPAGYGYVFRRVYPSK